MTELREVIATRSGTVVILIGCLVSYLITMTLDGAYAPARATSMILLVCIAVSIFLDWLKGLRNIIRSDIFALLALYFLLYFEFLFPQPLFVEIASPESVKYSITLTLIGFASMVVGRHFSLIGGSHLDYLAKVRIGPRDFLIIFYGAFILANLYPWLTVSFDFSKWFQALFDPRFSQPWSRGKYGDAKAILSELSLLGYLVPPIAGMIFAQRREIGVISRIPVLFVLLTQSFVAFSGGTRSILATYIASFMGGFFMGQKELKIKKVILHSLMAALLFVVLADFMLQFRTIGLSNYISDRRYSFAYKEFEDQYLAGGIQEDESYFVDYNLYTMSRLVEVFPDVYDFLGWNLPFVAATKPVPRFLWPGKPEDLKVGIEEALGITGMTVTTSFIGEAYISFGTIGVICISFLLGSLCCWWNQLAKHLGSPLALVVYTTGFFSILTTMRSLLFFTTTLLSTAALAVFALIIYKMRGAADDVVNK